MATASAFGGGSSLSQTASNQPGKTKAEVVAIDSIGTHQRSTEALSDLYIPDYSRLEVGRAPELLRSSIELSERAVECMADGDTISADDYTQRLQPVLRELFCCRALGDGFGIVVNSLIWGLHNRHGAVVEARHIKAIHSVLSAVCSEPFLSSDSAVDLALQLEDAGLDLTPTGFDLFTEPLNG
ncbi:MAG: hypothetical protein ABJF23_08670 [Bryobacteraceae bacterium]